MAESDQERAKRELREAVRRAVEGSDSGMPAPRNPALHDSQARGGAEVVNEKRGDT
jgi:hypothetical protein